MVPGVVSSADGVGRRDDRAPGLERSHDAGLRNGDGLLLHGLVDGGPVGVVHLVELVDQTDTLLRLNKTTSDEDLEKMLLGVNQQQRKLLLYES